MKATNKILAITFSTGLWVLLNSCASIPENAVPVQNFDADRYLGTWYEIARLDYRFEKNLDNVSAQYSLDKNGDVNVLNSGYNLKKKKWEKAEGRAKFRGDKNIAALKVSFFGPFYSGYNVVALDENYQYALVAGKNLDYLWILSKTKSIPGEVKTRYLNLARDIGYDTSALIWVKHDKNDNPFLK
ncbi:MAG: lipocalin family protein [Leadbetterella sp.]|nr:lipocalin family protein [Leadbetterella sp.]